ncbi:Manganese lipoxygenase [Madurella fahalii]|uniref:Manganese lipoxygenase n=1 Tax=Madurella fahalii TaxID=1157608 RepID=A0ABQ0GAJ3_9PEZI
MLSKASNFSSLPGRALAWAQSLWHKVLDTSRPPRKVLDPNLPTPPAKVAAVRPNHRAILKHPSEKEYFDGIAPRSVRDAPLPSFDPGIFDNELLKLRLYPTIDPQNPSLVRAPEGDIVEGSYMGTQVALTQAYSRIEQTFSSLFDVLGVEATLPRHVSFRDQKKLYQFSAYPKNADGTWAKYPPHLQHIPPEQDFSPFSIFNAIGLVETQVILQKITPPEEGILGRTKEWLVEKSRAAAFGGDPEKGIKIQDVVDYNMYHRKFGTDIRGGGNIGLLDDWYSDRRFADQQFTGTNPATLTRASPTWTAEFSEAAKAGNYNKWVAALASADPESLFVQDGSYIRRAIGVTDPEATLDHQQPGSSHNWAVGAVSLFQLHEDGKLHPIAICVDHKGSIEKSVTIFNQRMTPRDSVSGEKEDWPWRYAKTCAQITDWMRHELGVHLTLTHIVEEAIIVATNRTIPKEHAVYRLLSPHWYKTLSLNAAARATLVPQIIADIVGLSPDQCYSFIRDAYDTYDFVGSYVPNDLRRRGFPNTQEGLSHSRYRNYPYAKNVLALWTTLRAFVKSMLQLSFPTDDSVAADRYIQDWVKEVHTAAFMPSFPEIKTVDALIDAVTMCIHIASPFHSAINYLQNFYQMFVIAKPPSLCRPPPKTLAELRQYKEADLVASLPINRQRQWLLAAQVPWLLSFKVDADRSLMNYAASTWNVYRHKKDPSDQAVRDASQKLYEGLQTLQKTFYYNSRAMDKDSIPYMVLDPGVTAVSILI